MTFPQDLNHLDTSEQKPYTICHPTTAELRTHISDQVMAEYAISK